MEEERGYGERGNEAGERRDVGFDAEHGESAEKDKNGQRGDGRGELPGSSGVVALRPFCALRIGGKEPGDGDEDGEGRCAE